MLSFSSLNSSERTILMLMAYFYKYGQTKEKLSNLLEKIMLPSLSDLAFKRLMTDGLLVEVNLHNYGGGKVLYINKDMLIPSLFELFKEENSLLLQNIRRLYKKTYDNDTPSPLVRLIIYYIATNAEEAISTSYAQVLDSFNDCCLNLIDEREYESFFLSMTTELLSFVLNATLRMAMSQDRIMDWEYLKGLVFNRKKTGNSVAKRSELESVFAYYYYLGTGKICINLKTSVSDIFTLQIAAIDALYKGDYALAYRLYTKVMTANNKVALIKGIFVNPIANYYFSLAAIFTNTETSLKKLETMMKRNGDRKYTPTYFLVQPLKAYFYDKSDTNIQKESYLDMCKKPNMQMVSWLTWTMYPTFGILPTKATKPIDPPNWAFLQLETGIMESSSSEANLVKNFGGTSLLSRLEVKSLWQLRLETLIAENQTAENQTTETIRDIMLVYLLRYGIVVPILKRRLKNGSWSVGKELSIRELINLDIPGLDSIDQRIKEGIFSWDYSIYIEKYLYLFVDCDHIYTGSTYDLQPVKIHKDNPHLIIDKRSDGSFSVSTNVIELQNGEKTSFFYKKNSETDYSVFTPSDFEYKTYKEILAQETYPAEAESLLIQLIKAVGGKTEIHSNMVAELDDLERIDVEPWITLRVISSADNCFKLAAMVRITDSLCYVPGKGNVTTIAEQEGKKVQLVRNLKKERNNLKMISEGLAEAEFFEEGETWKPQSISETLTLPINTFLPFIQWCKEHKEICTMEWAEGNKIKFYPGISSSSAQISFKSKNGWFEIEGDVEFSEGHVISLQKLLEVMHQSVQQKYIRISDNEFITLSNQLSRILKRLDTVTTESRSHLQMAPAAVALLGDLWNDEALNIQNNDGINALRQRIEESSKKVPTIPKTLQAQLRDYQEEGFEWMSRLTAWGAGVCLADDMGLGKTVQTITLLLEQSENGPSLIVAPSSVVPNWRNELQRFAPSLNLTILNQSEDRSKDIKDAKAGDVIITTYGILNTQQEDLAGREWNVVCLDEAHTIKNANTKMSKSAMQLKAQRKVILTGTPIQNHLAELWNLFQFINPGLLGSAEQFKKKFILPIEGENDKARQSQLRRLISPFLLRRTKAEVVDELPAKNDIKLPVELSSEEMSMYEVKRREAEAMVLKNNKDKVSTLAEITRLRQMACSCSLVDKKWKLPSSKVLAFIDLAESLNDSGNRALVFSQFTSFFEEVKKMMDKAKLPYLYLDGSTPMAMREKLVKEFQTGKCPFFLISLKAGGLGLNLTGANYVIHLDPWWNPAIEQQATDRAYRIGQKQDVTVYHLISQHTIEEKILRLHKTKRNLSDSLLEGSDMSHAMTQEELLELLQDNR